MTIQGIYGNDVFVDKLIIILNNIKQVGKNINMKSRKKSLSLKSEGVKSKGI